MGHMAKSAVTNQKKGPLHCWSGPDDFGR